MNIVSLNPRETFSSVSLTLLLAAALAMAGTMLIAIDWMNICGRLISVLQNALITA